MKNSTSNSSDRGPTAPTGRDEPGWDDGTDSRRARLSPRQLLTLPIIAVVPSRRQATLYRWLRNEFFRVELDRLTAQAAEFTWREIESLAKRSFTVLTDLLEDPDSAVRLRASRAVAAMGIQWVPTPPRDEQSNISTKLSRQHRRRHRPRPPPDRTHGGILDPVDCRRGHRENRRKGKDPYADIEGFTQYEQPL